MYLPEAVVGDSLGFSLVSCCRLQYHREPHPHHTHSRSTSYINKVFQHILLWLLVIRIHTQPFICLVSHKVAAVGHSLGFSLVICCRLWLRPLIHFILIGGLLHTYIQSFSTFYHGWRPNGCNPALIYAGSVGESLGFSLTLCCRLWLRQLTHFVLQIYFVYV